MRRVFDILIGLFLFLLQITILHRMAVYGIIPDLLLIYVVSLGLIAGSQRGGFAGFVLGLIQDLYFGSLIGFSALFFMLIGACCGLFHQNFDRSRLMLPLGLTACFSMIYGLASSLFFLIIPGILSFSGCISQRVIPSVIYSCLFQVPVYVIMFLIYPLIKKAVRGLKDRLAGARER